MNSDEVLELMKNRRSIRCYTKEEVSEDAIRKILEAGRWCQSASNVQPWRFIIIKNRKIIKSLSKLATYGKFTRDAPIVIAIVADKKNAPKWYIHDTSMVSHQMCLMISALGLGTCWIGSMQRDKAAELLNLKNGEYLTTILPIGHPRSERSPTKRKELKDIISYIE
ncbi:MAG: hypothetical protein GF364_21515 [Candidatus Lokiarchaeota archaeon]|nr:hypothetical protein [Candidatus Lokiarchaeota archaeon]